MGWSQSARYVSSYSAPGQERAARAHISPTVRRSAVRRLPEGYKYPVGKRSKRAQRAETLSIHPHVKSCLAARSHACTNTAPR